MRRATPRLCDIVPAELAASVASQVGAHLSAQLAICRGYAAPEIGTSGLRAHVETLARYAVSGVGDSQLVSDGMDAIRGLMLPAIKVLDVRSMQRASPLVRAEPASQLGVVLAACHAREKLAHYEPVTLAELAVLHGSNHDYMQRLATAGELTGAYRFDDGRWMVYAAAARTWLGI